MRKSFVILLTTLFAVTLLALFNTAPTFAAPDEQNSNCAWVGSRLAAGSTGRVIPGPSNNLRSSASLYAPVIGRIPGGTTFAVMSGPLCAFNITWWQVQYNGVIGWTAEAQNNSYYLEPYTGGSGECGGMSPILSLNTWGYVLPGLPNALRTEPRTGSGSRVIGSIPGGGAFEVLSESACGSGYIWYRVNYNGIVGWTAQGANGTAWVAPYAPGNDCGGMQPNMYVGEVGYVLPGLPNALRSLPNRGWDSRVLGEIPAGAYFNVMDGPQCGSGYMWYLVNYNGIVGWTANGTNGTYWIAPAGF